MTLLASTAVLQAAQYHLYVGTYTGPKSEGIYVVPFDSDTGTLGEPKLAAKTANPTFIAINPAETHLFAANETGQWQGKPGGYVTAFQINSKTGGLKELNQQSTVGGGPCHVVVDKKGKYVLASNYGGGSIVALPINADGTLAPHSFFAQFTGSSVNPNRQKEPHAHSIMFSPDERVAYACDLGTDKLWAFAFSPEKGIASASTSPDVSLAPGSGPRHSAFSADGRHAYVINELLSTITAFSYEPRSGKLKEVQTISTLPEDFKGGSSTAEIRVHPNGRFVYGSNRGHDSIAVFTRDPSTGRLTAIGRTATGGKTPRNFNLDPSGKFLLAGNQGTGNVTIFRIEEATGKLAKLERELQIGSPVCLRFVRVK
jgi:6-phosphogluconolactonase